jgi:dCMP deaminase
MPKVTNPGPRPSWDEWALGLAAAVATRADCTRRQVGAVALAPDHRVLGTGYNGMPAGAPGCATEGACPRGRLGYDEIAASAPYVGGAEPCGALHAEENCAFHLSPDQRRGATLYVTDEPCPNCSRLLRGAGFARVVWTTESGGVAEVVF